MISSASVDSAVDMGAQIAALPQKRRDAYTLPPRGVERYVTLHYSGVVYKDRSHASEMQRILDEAAYQMQHNYGSAANPAYPDGLLYDFVVLSDGTIVRTRNWRVQLWHCGNYMGNQQSWAVHVMLGPGQDVTDAQQRAVFALIDELRARTNIPRANVASHCEWPRVNGEPVISDTYRLQPGQSACPGAVLHKRLTVAYRALRDTPRVWPVTLTTATPVYQDRRTDAPVAAHFDAGATIDVDDLTNGYYHAASGTGFFPESATQQTTAYRVHDGIQATLRDAPNRQGTIVQTVAGGTVVQVVRAVQGQSVAGTDIWFLTVDGLYVHSGAVKAI